MTRDERAISAIKSVLTKELAGLSPERIIVTARENHSGEPALYVLVVVTAEQDIPGEREQNRLVVRMVDALDQLEESRFPYLYFGFNHRDDGSRVEALSTDEKA